MSSYVDDELYERLRAFAADSTRLGRSDFGNLRTEVEPLILHEARLLDDGRYREWLDLLTEEAIYWIPLSRFDDPATTWSIAFDDRRRIEDRVAWLGTGKVHGQSPPSRTQRSLASVEVWPIDDDTCRSRCAFICDEYRPDQHRHWTGTIDYRLVRQPTTPAGLGNWQIAWKIIVLIDAEGPQENLTIIL